MAIKVGRFSRRHQKFGKKANRGPPDYTGVLRVCNWKAQQGVQHSWAQRKLSPLSPLNPLNILLSINGPLLFYGFNGLND